MMQCNICDSELTEGNQVCTCCGSPIEPTADIPAPKKESKIILWILAVFGGLLVITIIAFIIAGLQTNWFYFYGPAGKIAAAANNTFSAGNFTMDITGEIIYDSTVVQIDGTAAVMIDQENRDLKLYAPMSISNQNMTIVIYDHYLVFEAGWINRSKDISAELEVFFDNLEKDKTLDWEEFLNSIQEGLYDEVSEVIAFDALETCLVQYYKNLNNDQWLEDNAGYSFTQENDEDLYQFKPQPYKFLDTSLACFQDAFVDQDKYDELASTLEDSKKTIQACDVTATFGVTKRELTSLDIMFIDGSTFAFSCEIDFTKIGDTSIDESILKQLMPEAY